MTDDPNNNSRTIFKSRFRLGCRRWIAIVLLIAIDVVFPTQGLADVIWIRGQNGPIYGRIESESDQEVQIRVFENGRYGQKTGIPREQIDLLVVNIDAKRLAQLDPSKPESYRDYAEELASQKNDPAAKALAQRLYLLAAASAEPNRTKGATRKMALRRSALLGLAAIEDSAAERRRIDVLRHLIDPDSSDIGTLTAGDRASIPQSISKKQLMLELVHAIRQEKSERARQLLNSPENRSVFEGWRELCSFAELEQMALVNRPSRVQLSKLLAIELQIVRDVNSANISTPQHLNWGDYAVQVSNTLGVLPTLENITPFDPRKSVFRDGIWVEPLSK